MMAGALSRNIFLRNDCVTTQKNIFVTGKTNRHYPFDTVMEMSGYKDKQSEIDAKEKKPR